MTALEDVKWESHAAVVTPHNCLISLKFRRNLSLLGKEQEHLSEEETKRCLWWVATKKRGRSNKNSTAVCPCTLILKGYERGRKAEVQIATYFKMVAMLRACLQMKWRNFIPKPKKTEPSQNSKNRIQRLSSLSPQFQEGYWSKGNAYKQDRKKIPCFQTSSALKENLLP